MQLAIIAVGPGGKVVAITGASAGVGRHRYPLRKIRSFAILARDAASLNEAKAQMASMGASVMALAVDVVNPDAVFADQEIEASLLCRWSFSDPFARRLLHAAFGASHRVPGTRLIRAAEELTLLRTVAGAFDIALQGVVVFRRTLFISSISILVGGGSRRSISCLNSPIGCKRSGFSTDMVRSRMGLVIREQATLPGLNDAFLLGAFAFFARTAFVWLAQ